MPPNINVDPHMALGGTNCVRIRADSSGSEVRVFIERENYQHLSAQYQYYQHEEQEEATTRT